MSGGRGRKARAGERPEGGAEDDHQRAFGARPERRCVRAAVEQLGDADVRSWAGGRRPAGRLGDFDSAVDDGDELPCGASRASEVHPRIDTDDVGVGGEVLELRCVDVTIEAGSEQRPEVTPVVSVTHDGSFVDLWGDTPTMHEAASRGLPAALPIGKLSGSGVRSRRSSSRRHRIATAVLRQR
jgi:hypothetical protein